MILEVDKLQIDYQAKDGVTRAVDGASFVVPEGRIVGPDGKLYAHASTTCLIFDH